MANFAIFHLLMFSSQEYLMCSVIDIIIPGILQDNSIAHNIYEHTFCLLTGHNIDVYESNIYACNFSLNSARQFFDKGVCICETLVCWFRSLRNMAKCRNCLDNWLQLHTWDLVKYESKAVKVKHVTNIGNSSLHNLSYMKRAHASTEALYQEKDVWFSTVCVVVGLPRPHRDKHDFEGISMNSQFTAA